MIFLTIGSHEPFNRLVKAVDVWAGDAGNGSAVFGQITSRARHIPEHFQYVASMEPSDYARRCSQADLIISHVGLGTIITALTFGTPALLMPRRGHLGETRNDHQVATARHLGDRPGLYIAETEDDLPALLDKLTSMGGAARSSDGLSPVADARLTGALRDFIFRE
ncbi:MAG: hypothetical protein GY788_29295 [bacterium]|nr:hypothetical protein [bacterium]